MIGKRLLELHKPRTGERLSFKERQYFVFPDGRVWNHKRRRFVKQYELTGYMAVSLRDDNGREHSSIGVHALLATCYIRLLDNGEVVHHKDHNRKNNNLPNLEIISASEHSRHHDYESWKDGRFQTRNVGNYYSPAKQVAQLSLDGRLIRVWPSTAECGRNGYNFGHVSACCRGCYSTHRNNVYKGYVWQWYDEYLSSQPTAQQQWEARQLHLAF